MKKVKLADVLWDAANEHLLPDSCDDGNPQHQWYSCNAIECALDPNLSTVTLCLPDEVREWLTAIGCDCGSSVCFRDHAQGEARQGVRYMWLLLAMHVAEDEGIEIEVEP